MSDAEEENFCFLGKPLDPYDEDAFPKKRPISLEDQIATDAQGRRRFHGAFTGGFSAGFFNTVGSLEGWTPSDFKSTRHEKTRNVVQKPQDFMDQEDLEEYGIAPQTVRATKEYSTSKKRRKQMFSEGPIPGIPVLETLLTSGNETIGYLLMKKLGIKDKIKKRDHVNSDTKVYGCDMPNEFRIPKEIENIQYKVPEIYTHNLAKPKSNTFGLGYEGLDRSHVNLFTTSNLVVTDRNNKKFSIAGQAFGVGAFEEDDDDIYMKEDMSNYDFELRKEKQTKPVNQEEVTLYFGLFKPSKAPLVFKKVYLPPTIPHSFTGKHKIRKSRFESVEVKVEKEEEIDRRSINPAIRARYLGEETVTPTPSQPILEKKTEKEKRSSKSFDVSSLMCDKFVSASGNEDITTLEPERKSETEHGTQDMREAAKMSMFGPLTRITTDWTPCAILCRRFNVPEPLMDRPELKNRKRTKNLIFENQKHTDDDQALLKPGCSTSCEDVEVVPSISQNTNEANDEEINVLKTEQMSPDEEKEIHLQEGIQDKSIDKGEEKQDKDDEISKDITDKIGIEEKVDLFKAVFLSSSESEDDDDKEEEADKKTEEFKETILSDLVPKIRPLKQGILSNLSFQPINPVKENDQTIKEENSEIKNILFVPRKQRETAPKILSYGPQLPAESNKSDLNTNTISLMDSDADEWVEKDDSKEGKKKHKKNKKNKKKHKHSKKDR